MRKKGVRWRRATDRQRETKRKKQEVDMVQEGQRHKTRGINVETGRGGGSRRQRMKGGRQEAAR